jgi:hypothetical protein
MLTATDVEAVPQAEIGQPNGVATLNGSGELPEVQLPSSVANSSATRTPGQAYVWNGTEWRPESVAKETLNSTYGEVEAEGAITPDIANGNVIAVRMKGNLTVEVPTGARETDRCYFRVENGPVTAHTLKLSSAINKPNGEPKWNTTPGASNTFTLVTTNAGTTWELVTGPEGPEGARGSSGIGVYPWQMNNLLGWSHDPVCNAGSPVALTSGTVLFARLLVTPGATLTALLIAVVTAGKTLTSGECLLGVYKHNAASKEGILIGTTGDQSGTWESTGAKEASLTASETGSLKLSEETTHLFVGILANGTTMPVFAGIEKAAYGFIGLLPETGLRIASWETTGQTTLPSSYKLTTTKEASKPIWVGCK